MPNVRFDPEYEDLEAELLTRSGDDGSVVYLILTTPSRGRLSFALRTGQQVEELRTAVLELAGSFGLGASS